MRDFRMEIVRNGVPIGNLFCTSVTIRFDSESEVMRGMRMSMNLYAMDGVMLFIQDDKAPAEPEENNS